jgi:hypothetical protein
MRNFVDGDSEGRNRCDDGLVIWALPFICTGEEAVGETGIFQFKPSRRKAANSIGEEAELPQSRLISAAIIVASAPWGSATKLTNCDSQ